MAENGTAVAASAAAEPPAAPAAAPPAAPPAPAAAPTTTAAAAPAAAAALPSTRQIPTVEQCRVLQTVIKLLEHNDDAKKMLPLASMSAEMLQTTLANSPQPINVADVLSKLAPHLESSVSSQLWEQYHKGAAPGREGASAAAKVVAAATFAGGRRLIDATANGAAAALSQAAPLAPGAPNPAHAKLKKQAYTANNKVCGCCHETYHASFSPLILCDFCPQAFHIFCLGLDWAELPEAEWACPSCLPLPAGARGAMGLAGRQRVEADRLVVLERERQERERKRAEERLIKEAAKAKEKADREKAKLDSKRFARHVPDDIDLAAEEAAEAARLATLLPQLRDAADREGGKRAGSGMLDGPDESGEGLPPLPPGGRRAGTNPGAVGAYGAFGAGVGAGSYMGMGIPSSATDQLREASDRLRKLQATAAGPPPLKDVITDDRVLHSLMDALAVSEFLATFSAVCGAPQLNLAQLQQAVAWPLDGPELFEVYTVLVKYLLAQWSHIESGHVGARVRRWARCMERSSAVGNFDEDVLSNGHAPNGNATWQELLRRYCLLSRSSLRVKESELKPNLEYATMSDDLIMVHAAVELGKQAIWKMPPEFHLRLIHALCNDVINCYNMKAEISSRLDTSIALQIEKFHADAEERKKEKEAARLRREAALAARDKRTRELMASSNTTPAPEGTGTPDPSLGPGQPGAAGAESSHTAGDEGNSEPPLKRARSSSGMLDEGGEGTPGPGDGRDGTPDTAADLRSGAGWKHGEDRDAREAALQTELMRYMIRSDPLGMDRHHQRYWHMQSDPSVIFVESAEGDNLGLITSKAQLDALIISLNKKGAREASLHQALMKNYSKFCRCLRPPAALDMRRVVRNRRMRRDWLKHASSAMPANTPLDEAGYPSQQQQQQQQDIQQVPDYNHLLAESEATAVAAALSELESLVSQLVGVGIYNLTFKEWRKKLRGKRTVDELCQMLEEFEAQLSKVGDGQPPGVTDEAMDEFIREADIYEAEFVMPVSAAELAEQQEAAAAAAAAAKAEKAENGEGDDMDPDPDDAKAAAEEAAAAAKSASKSKSKKGGSSSSSKKGKSSASAKKGGKKGAAAAEEDDSTNPDAAAHKGPMVTLFSGATRVRKAGHVKQEQHVKQEVKQEPGDVAAAAAAAGGGGDIGVMDVDGAAVKQEEGQFQEQDLTKMVSPLEELDDSDVEAEKRYQEKRAAEKAGEPIPPPPVVLWRSTREWGVWVKDLRRARMTGALGGAAYAAAALVDRTHRLMSNLALAKIRTGAAAAIAEDRDAAVQRKSELLLGPVPFDPASLLSPEDLKAAAAAAAAATPEPTMVTSTGRRVKGTAEPRRKMSARQRNKRGTPGDEDEWFMYGDEFGGGFEGDIDEPPPPPPEGKWGLACLVCGGGGEVACCEVPGCSVLMHLGCAGMPDADYYYCPDHMLSLQQPWQHTVSPPAKYQVPTPPPVRPNVP